MKHWCKKRSDTISLLAGGFSSSRILDLTEIDGNFRFREACDSYFCVLLTKQELKEALQEVIEWVDSFEKVYDKTELVETYLNSHYTVRERHGSVETLEGKVEGKVEMLTKLMQKVINELPDESVKRIIEGSYFEVAGE